MRLKRISIKWKVFLYLIGFCVLLIGILWLFQTVFLDQFYTQIKRSAIEKEATRLAAYFENEDLDSLYGAIEERGDIFVEVWSEQAGTVFSAMEKEQKPNVSARPPGEPVPTQYTTLEKKNFLSEARAAGGKLTKRFSSNGDFDRRRKESLLCAVVMSGGTEERLLMVSANISPVNATVDTLRVQFIYISAIMLLLSVGLALLISRRVSGPIENLNESAKELADGNYDIAFCGEGYREIAELSDTLDHAARELSKTEELRKELIANVSHDLRTPLTLITGYGEMIRDLPDENTPENMQVIIDEARRLTSLVGNLLDLSRLQSGISEMRRETFDLTEETGKIIGRFSKFCEQEQYDIRFEYDRSVRIEADPERIAQVIYNYICNAITHTGEDKIVTVRQTIENGRVTLAVIDTGEGIAPENKGDIWERYYKADKTHKRDVEGSGLGLSIVKSILTQHPNVDFGVESEPGEGSRFWFSLPLAE